MKETIGILIVIAAVLYVMFHHNQALGAPTNAPTFGIGNPLGVGGGGGGGGTTLGGIGHSYSTNPPSAFASAGGVAPPTNNIRLVNEGSYAPAPTTSGYTPPVAVAPNAGRTFTQVYGTTAAGIYARAGGNPNAIVA